MDKDILDELDKLCETCYLEFSTNAVLFKVLEEISELIQVIAKFYNLNREERLDSDIIDRLKDKSADCFIMLNQLNKTFNFENRIKVKIKAIKEKLKLE
jgi:NTP pyrophosphatase (non-canonical NTP hydrolase)